MGDTYAGGGGVLQQRQRACKHFRAPRGFAFLLMCESRRRADGGTCAGQRCCWGILARVSACVWGWRSVFTSAGIWGYSPLYRAACGWVVDRIGLLICGG